LNIEEITKIVSHFFMAAECRAYSAYATSEYDGVRSWFREILRNGTQGPILYSGR
jgi:hypothetical protein